MQITFPNETPAYRTARAALLTAELELREKLADVAAQRRALPPGGAVPEDYRFTGTDDTPRRLSDLFGDRQCLALYSLMYADSLCPMCTSMLDGLEGQARHISQRMAFAVVAAAPAEKLRDLAATRGWHNLTLLSAAGTSYQRDYHAETPDGAQLPIMNVFTRDGGTIRHFWGSEGFFADLEGHPRHVDQLWPLWNMFDLTPIGRGEDWYPALSYE